MPRQDYYDDPAAPAANTIVPAVTAIVRNEHGEVLMIDAPTTIYGRYQAAPKMWASP